MELALKEAEGREAELDTAQHQAHADMKRARAAVVATERKVEMGEHVAPAPAPASVDSGRSSKEKHAAAKLQARRRGHAARGAMEELHVPPFAAGGRTLPPSLAKRLQDTDAAPQDAPKTRHAAAASAPPPPLQQLLATVSVLEVALADPATPAADKPAMEARLSSAKAEVAVAAVALPSQPAASAPASKAEVAPAVASAFTEMRSEMKLWAGGSLPAGKDSGVAEEAKLRKIADESLRRVESVLSVSELRNISQDLAHRETAQSRADAVVAQLKGDLQSAYRRACAAFPAVAGPGGDIWLGGAPAVSHALGSMADFVERAAAMQEAMQLAAAEELAAARAEAAALAAAAAERPPAADEKEEEPPGVTDEPLPIEEVPATPPAVEQPVVPIAVAEEPAAAPVVAPSPAVVCEDQGCNPHASLVEVLRFMLHEAGLLDPATREDALTSAGGPETELAKLVRMFQSDDKIRAFSEGSATSEGQTDRPRSAPLASVRLPSQKAALPPLGPDEMALWEQQLVELKQRLQAEAERAAEAERRAKELIAQLRGATRQKAEEAEQPIPFSTHESFSADDVNQLRRLLSLMTPGLHGQRLPWSPRLTASGSPAVVHARGASPTEKACDEEAPGQAPEAAGAGKNVFCRLQSRESRSSSRWQQRRADLQEETARSTEAVMQAYASVRHTGAVFAQMRSRFDGPPEGPDPGAGGSFDKLLARAQMTDPALPPVRRGGVGAGATSPEPWGSRAGTPWQPVQSLGRPYDAIGTRAAQFNIRPSPSSPASNQPRSTVRPASVQRPVARGSPQLKALNTSSTSPALY